MATVVVIGLMLRLISFLNHLLTNVLTGLQWLVVVDVRRSTSVTQAQSYRCSLLLVCSMIIDLSQPMTRRGVVSSVPVALTRCHQTSSSRSTTAPPPVKVFLLLLHSNTVWVDGARGGKSGEGQGLMGFSFMLL